MKYLSKITEGIAVALLVAMFLSFLLQIFSRYVLTDPFGWTLELCLTLWVWLVFWSNAFVVKHKEHVSFDMIYQGLPLHAPKRARRTLAFIASLLIVIALAASLLPTWDFIDFLKIKKSASLRIPMRTVYSIYAVFLIGVVATYGYRCWYIVRHGIPEEEAEQ